MINFHILRQASLCNNFNECDYNNNSKRTKDKGPQPSQPGVQRVRNTRQFGTDITNKVMVTTSMKQILKKKKPFQTISLNHAKDLGKPADLRSEKQILHIPVSSSVGLSAQVVDNETCSNTLEEASTMLESTTQTANLPYVQINPQLAFEYFEEISNTLIEAQESEGMIYAIPNYMSTMQNDIHEKMRVILFDWLVDVHLKWELSTETLYLTFNLIDRFLCLRYTSRDFLQCVGVAALLIACKYEEVYFPDLKDFIEVTDYSFSKQQILEKELEILSLLEFNITVPSSLSFFEIYNIQLNLEGREKSCALFLIELAAFDYNMLKYKPSLIAAGCLMLIVYRSIVLKERLYNSCKHNTEQISSVCHDLIQMYQQVNHGSKSISRKYSGSKYHKISVSNIFDELNH